MVRGMDVLRPKSLASIDAAPSPPSPNLRCCECALIKSAAESAALFVSSADGPARQTDKQLKTNKLRLVWRVPLQGREEEIQGK